MLPSCYGIFAEAIRTTTIRPEFTVPTDLLILYTHDHSTKIYGLRMIFCTTIQQKIRVLIDLFFYVHTTIGPKCTVLFHLFFLLSTTIRPKITVHTALFLFFVHDHSTKVYGPHSFIISFVHDHSTKIYMVFFHLFFLLCLTIRSKIKVHTDVFLYMYTTI